MKILYFHQHFSTPSGSTGIRSYEMATRLIKRGHYVVIVCGSYKGGNTGLKNNFKSGFRRGKVDGIEVFEFDLPYANADNFFSRSFKFVKFILLSIKIIFTEDYDLIFTTTTPLTIGIPGILAKYLRKKPFVFEIRDLWPEQPKALGVIKNPIILGLMHLLEWISYRSADFCIGLSPGIVEGIKKIGVPDNKVALIPNGCDLKIFSDI